MSFILLLEQIFNGLQFGVTLFLIAAGLTLILGIMDFVFLAHGAQVMIGAYAAASLTALTGNFYLGILLAIPITFASGCLLEYLLIRHLYRRNHMDQVLATFGLILFFNELIRIGFGPAALFSSLPPSLSGFVNILPDTPYPVFRLLVIAVGLAASSSMVRPRAIAVKRAASRTRPSPIDIDRNTLSVIVRFTKVVSRWRVLTGRSFGASVWLPKKWMTLKLCPSIISFL